MKKILALLAMFPGSVCILWFLYMLFQEETTRWEFVLYAAIIIITYLFVFGLAVLFDWE